MALDWLAAVADGSPEQEYRAALAGFQADPAGWTWEAMSSSLRARRAQEALRYYDLRDTTTLWVREWRAWDDRAMAAFHMLGRFEEELPLARKARAEAPSNLGHLLREGGVLAAMGRTDDVERLIAESYGFEDPFAPGSLMNAVWYEQSCHASPAEARATAERLITWIQGLPDERRQSIQAANLMGWALAGLDRFGDLRNLYLARAREPEKWPVAGWGSGQVREAYRVLAMDASVALGDTAGALTMVQELQTPTSSRAQLLDGDRDTRAWRFRRESSIMAGLGRKAEAVALIREWLNHGGRFDEDAALDGSWRSLHDYPPFQELVRIKG